MTIERTVEIANESGSSISIPLAFEGGRESALLRIEGVQYRFERIPKEQLVSQYRVDDSPAEVEFKNPQQP